MQSALPAYMDRSVSCHEVTLTAEANATVVARTLRKPPLELALGLFDLLARWWVPKGLRLAMRR